MQLTLEVFLEIHNAAGAFQELIDLLAGKAVLLLAGVV
jgi:hypothetical protein